MVIWLGVFLSSRYTLHFDSMETAKIWAEGLSVFSQEILERHIETVGSLEVGCGKELMRDRTGCSGQERPGAAATAGAGDSGGTSLVMQGVESCGWQQGPCAAVPMDSVVLTFLACGRGSC